MYPDVQTNGRTRLGPPRDNSNPNFEDFFENGAVALHVVGSDGKIIHANKSELKLLGYPEEEYIGHDIRNFHVDAHVIEDILARLTRGEQITNYPARLRAYGGSIRHVEITSSGMFRGAEFISTRCFTRDVTELVNARAELRAKDERFRQVLEALPAAIYTTDSFGRITYFNRAAAELAGREPIIGKDEWCVTYRLRMPDGTPLPLSECPMAIALKENRAVRGVEALAERPDGSLVPFLPFPTPLRSETGELVGAVNMLVDISDRKEAEANQRTLLNELNHRVKNNLQMLQGLLSAAQRETSSTDAKQVLNDACTRVAAMAAAQQLLYSDSNPHGFKIHDFLHAVCESARQLFSKEVVLHTEGDAGHLWNEASMPLALILNELLTNAAKHGGRGKGKADIKVSLKKREGKIILCVQDDGPGFELRKSGKKSSGLGLVAGLAYQLSGKFDIQMNPTRCTVILPDRTAS